MAKKPKTWREKLEIAKAKPGLPKVFFCDKAKMKFVVLSPADVERIMMTVPPGKLMTMAQIGGRLKKEHGADMACPMTTGIFAWIVANAAEEAANTDANVVTGAADTVLAALPWWRVLKTGGLLNPKYPGGGKLQKQRLAAEGHRVVQKGKNLIVADHERALVDE